MVASENRVIETMTGIFVSMCGESCHACWIWSCKAAGKEAKRDSKEEHSTLGFVLSAVLGTVAYFLKGSWHSFWLGSVTINVGHQVRPV